MTSITLEKEFGFKEKCVSTTYGHVWISHSMAYVLVLQRRLEAMPDIPVHEQNMDFARGVCFQQHAMFQADV